MSRMSILVCWGCACPWAQTILSPLQARAQQRAWQTAIACQPEDPAMRCTCSPLSLCSPALPGLGPRLLRRSGVCHRQTHLPPQSKALEASGRRRSRASAVDAAYQEERSTLPPAFPRIAMTCSGVTCVGQNATGRLSRYGFPSRRNGPGSAQRWRPRTPALAAGLTDHVWTGRKGMLLRLPPGPQPQTLEARGEPDDRKRKRASGAGKRPG